jgi:hypothetical protein
VSFLPLVEIRLVEGGLRGVMGGGNEWGDLRRPTRIVKSYGVGTTAVTSVEYELSMLFATVVAT